ncbi:3-oxoacyl-ACP synthase III family protein [Desertivirga xinjiangensis]|uniref:3-oxoacyl-ACP synthase III family protein n=1 Tax=Desertivirga xinjiangensis TaxID=539206 RepID=UPI0021095F57|nr:ketoacyl-ACP synthase III [Pedobacter xinjiangensis]
MLKTIGVDSKRKVQASVTCSDLCYQSAEALLKAMEWAPEEIEILIYVSQTRDFLLPCTAIVLQDRLKLPKSCIAFDVPLGCSGYPYGISVIAGMMSAAKIKKGLLLCGDTSTLTVSPEDKKTFPLFGDAGSATALEYVEDSGEIVFSTGSDGSGYDAIMVPGGGSKEPLEDGTHEIEKKRLGYRKGRTHLHMDGSRVFEFSINTVPESINELFSRTGHSPETIDFFLMHQANLIMNETIRKKLKFPLEKVPYSLKNFGNTSSASIPLTMVSQIKDELSSQERSLLMSGFGVGLSWASLILKTDSIFIHDLIEYDG